MRRKGMKKILSLLMAVVMLFSSSVVYLPTFATSNPPPPLPSPPDYTIVEGEQIGNKILEDHKATDLLLKDQFGLTYWVNARKVWVRNGNDRFKWVVKDVSLRSKYTDIAAPMTGTSDLPVGDYEIYVIKVADSRCYYSKLLSLRVNSNTPPVGVSYTLDPTEGYDEVATITRREIDLSLLKDDDDKMMIRDIDGHMPTLLSAVSNKPEVGNITVDGLKILYDQAANFSGPFEITYILRDGFDFNVSSVPYIIGITVEDSINDAPVASNVFMSTPVNIKADVNVDMYVTDTENDGVTISDFGNVSAEEGLVTKFGNILSYMPAAGYTGTVNFSYTVKDNTNRTSTALITIYVVTDQSVNELTNHSGETDENVAITVDVLFGEILKFGFNGLSIKSVTNGMAIVTGDNKIMFTPTADYYGSSTIIYTVTDRLGGTVDSTLTITINKVLDGRLEARDDVLYVDERSGYYKTREVITILENDIFEDGLTNVSIITDPEHGTFKYRNGKYYYYPDFIYSGPDYFEYEITDVKGLTSRAIVFIEVLEKNIDRFDPCFLANKFNLNEGETVNEFLFCNWMGFIDKIDDVVIVNAPTYGQVEIGTDGYMTYKAHPTFTGTDWVKYKLVYKSGNTATKYAKFIIGPTDDLLLSNDIAIVNEDSIDNKIFIQLNDIVIENIVEVGLVDINKHPMIPDPIKAELVLSGNEYYVKYSPGLNFNGTDTLSYYVEDEDGFEHKAIIEITVLPLEDLYDIDLPDKAVLMGNNITFNTLTSIADEFIYVKDVVITSPPAFGDVLAGIDGNITYTPGTGNAGPVTIAYTYSNEFGDIASGTVKINVFMNNDKIIVDFLEERNYFMQQFSTEGLYLLDRIKWITEGSDNKLIKWVGVIREHGLIADDFGSGTIEVGNAINSYGEFYLSYFGQDEKGNVGQAYGYRKLRINFQPILQLSQIELDANHKPMATVEITSAEAKSESEPFDLELFFGSDDLDLSLFGKLYLFDHEDYAVEGLEAPFIISTPLTEKPDDIDIKFLVNNVELNDSMNQGVELTDDNLWQHLIVPFNMTEKIFELRFFAVDSDDGVSKLTNVYRVKVKNNRPTFMYGEEPVEENYLYMPTLYTDTTKPLNVWEGIKTYDIEAEWFVSDLNWAVTTWFEFRKVNEATLEGEGFVDGVAFTNAAGLYELKYYVKDANGEMAMSRRYMEVNTDPTIDSLVNPLILQVGQLSYDLKENIEIVDLDIPVDDLSDKYTVYQYYDFDKDRVGTGLDENNWMNSQVMFSTESRGLYNVSYVVSDDPWSTINDSVDGSGFGTDIVERLVWVNEAPVLTLTKEREAILINSEFDPLSLISAKDFEDDYLGIPLVINYTSSNVSISETTEMPVFDTSVAGIYNITYTVIDSMNGHHEVILTLYIVEPTTVSLTNTDVNMDLGGYFPTFYGIEANFWNEYSVLPTQIFEESNIKRTLIAMIGDTVADEFMQFENYGSYEIKYIATLWLNVNGEWQSISEAFTKRTVNVLEKPFENYIYALDYGMNQRAMKKSGVDELPNTSAVPVLVKINPDNENDMRFVSAMMLENKYAEAYDVAETKDGKVYVLLNQSIYLYNATSGELTFVYELSGTSFSLAANGDGHLVAVLSGAEPTASGLNDSLFEMVFIDPNAVATVADSESMVVMSKFFRAPYHVVTDITFSDDLTKIYGIGYRYQMSSEDSGTIVLFELLPYEDTAQVSESASLDYMIGNTYDMGTMFYHEGIATLGKKIYVTKSYMGSELNIEEYELGDTFIDSYMQEAEGFVFVESLKVNGFTTFYSGAGSTFDTFMTLTPETKSISVGYNKTAADGLANFVVTLFPEVAFESAIWEITSEGNYIKNNNKGEFEAIEANITGSHTATIKVSVVLKATGETYTKEATISISKSFAPAAPAAVVPQAVVTVAVSLDIDAITLDYGGTADPDFLSYDFSELVTGTTNTDVTWSLDDDTYATVDQNGVVTVREDVPVDTGDITVELTVRTVDGGAFAKAIIIFEEQAPLGAIEFYAAYITGYPNGRFEPDKFVSRAEVATMFGKFLRLDESTIDIPVFTDVAEEHWAYDHIQVMFEVGIFKGYKNEDKDDDKLYFDPEAPIKRSEIAQVFTNYWEYLGISVAGQSSVEIPDVDADYWAYEAINRVFNTGLFLGFEDDTFRPEDPTLRVQLVTMINKLLDRPQVMSETNSFSDVLSDHRYYGDIEAASQTFLKPQGE